MFISRNGGLFFYGTLTCFGAVASPYHLPATFSIPSISMSGANL